MPEQDLRDKALPAAVEPEPRVRKGGEKLLAGLLVPALSVIVLNLPLVLYGLIYDRYPHIITSIFYFGAFLLLAFVAAAICSKALDHSVELIFGLQVMFCTLPGLFIGSFLASPYFKTTLLQPVQLESPVLLQEPSFAGYYQIQSAELRGDLQGSASKTRHTKSGDSTTRVTTTYYVAPLVPEGWDNKSEPPRFWVVRESDGFKASANRLTSFHVLATRSTSTLEQAMERSAERHHLESAEEPLFLLEMPAVDQAWYGRYLAISMGVLNLLVLGAVGFMVWRA